MTGHTRSRLLEDRALRNAAKGLVKADLARIRNGLETRSVGERAKDRITEGAIDLYEEAAIMAEDNKGVLAALTGAVVLWFARNPILSLFTDDDDEEFDRNGEPRPWSERFCSPRR